MACLDDDDADERRTCQGTDAQAHVETDVAIGWTQVHEVAEANGDDTAHSHSWQQASRNAEDGREAHRRYGCRNGELPVFVVRSHRKVRHEVVDVANLDGKGNAECHGKDHQQGVQGANHSHLDVAVEHVAHEVDQRNSRHDEEGARHQWVPRGV